MVLDGNVPCLGASGRPGHHPTPDRQEVRSCVQTNQRPLRVALVSYRSKAHVGGQGIYLRHLSRELAALGHHVEVFSGQPYPELEPGPVLRTLPSLDLYREPDPFRTPKLPEYRDWIDVLEFLWMKTGAFPEPFTFSLRLRRALLARLADFDLVHDNQVLAYGLLALPRAGMPLVTSIHHPISVDRRIELKAARGLSKLAKWRWYTLRPDAGQGGPPLRHDPDRVAVVGRGHLPRFRRGAGQRAGHPAWRGHPPVPSPARAARPRPHDRRGQRRRLPDQGRGDAAAGVRQAGHRAGRAAHRGRQARSRAAPPRSLPPNWRSATRCASRTASATPSLPNSPPAPRSRWCRRCTRGSRCPRSSTWRQARRWSSAAPGHCPRW